MAVLLSAASNTAVQQQCNAAASGRETYRGCGWGGAEGCWMSRTFGRGRPPSYGLRVVRVLYTRPSRSTPGEMPSLPTWRSSTVGKLAPVEQRPELAAPPCYVQQRVQHKAYRSSAQRARLRQQHQGIIRRSDSPIPAQRQRCFPSAQRAYDSMLRLAVRCTGRQKGRGGDVRAGSIAADAVH